MKECKKCKDMKKLEDFPKRKANKDGRDNTCKVCINERVKNSERARSIKASNRIAKAEKEKQLLMISTKTCACCKQTKPKTEFNKASNTKDKFSVYCKICKRLKDKNRRLQNLEVVRQRDRDYMANNKEAKAASDSKYREANKEKLSQHKKEYYRENFKRLSEKAKQRRLNRTSEEIKRDSEIAHKKYLNESPEQKARRAEYGKNYHKTESGKLSSRVNAQKRRANKISTSDGTVTAQALENLKELQNNKCYYCNCELLFTENNKVHLDHYIPLSKGGIHSIENVVWSCSSCNYSKGDTIPNDPLMLLDV